MKYLKGIGVVLARIILLEDIDCAVQNRGIANTEKPKDGEKLSLKSPLTLSGLLNALDGVMSPSGVIYCMTTNHVDSLDPALLRPGRCDVRMEFGLLTQAQTWELYKRFFPEDKDEVVEAFVRHDTSKTPAELQGKLLEIRNERLGTTI